MQPAGEEATHVAAHERQRPCRADAALQEDRTTIEAAGLSGKVDRLREKLLDRIERAVRALDWVGIPEELLAEWVDAHLQAEARGEGTFEIGTKTVVMNEAGQVSLFGGRDE